MDHQEMFVTEVNDYHHKHKAQNYSKKIKQTNMKLSVIMIKIWPSIVGANRANE